MEDPTFFIDKQKESAGIPDSKIDNDDEDLEKLVLGKKKSLIKSSSQDSSSSDDDSGPEEISCKQIKDVPKLMPAWIDESEIEHSEISLNKNQRQLKKTTGNISFMFKSL